MFNYDDGGENYYFQLLSLLGTSERREESGNKIKN